MPPRTTATRATEHAVGRPHGGVARTDRIVRNRTEDEVVRTRNKGGRPKGAKNKPKSMLPAALADEILKSMEPILPKEQYAYLHGVIMQGKSISTRQELDTIILLLNRNIWPALVAEQAPADGGPTTFRKDVTERLKVLNSLLTLRNQIDKREGEDGNDEGAKPLLKIWASRDIAGRVAVLVGNRADSLAGNPDGVERPALPARTVSDQVSERPLDIPPSQ